MNKTNIDVINKLEKFGYGYQKTFKTKTIGNLKRQVSNGKGKLKKARSLIRNKDNQEIGYDIDDENREDDLNFLELERRGSKKKALRKYRSLSKNKSAKRRGSRIGRKKSHQLLKSKSNNIDRVLTTAKHIVRDKRSKSKGKKNLRKK
mmetsp:Transcript_1335/g.1191  ORF Transcript_1335/g.1191 Transcript_1335/m.1191 type:complete len:148 (+) Transcript_1335:442-885(+)